MEPPIIHIGPTPFFSNRGCHIRILNEIRGLEARGKKVILCTYGLGNDVDGLDIRRICSIPGYTKTGAGFSPFKPLADLLLFFLVLRVAYQERVRIIHAHLHEGGLIGWCVKIVLFWRRITLIMDIQGSLSGELRSYGTFNRLPFLLSVFYFIERLICLMPDKIVCSSSASRTFLIQSCRVKDQKIELVGDVVPDSFFLTSPASSLRNELGISAGTRLVIYTGSLLPGKGVDYLLEAIEPVLGEHHEVLFVLVGYPKSEIENYVDRAGFADRVMLPGEVDYADLSLWLGSADLAVDPKASGSGEASGKILHYMAAGLPVVCFNTENNRAFLGEHAFYAGAISSSELAAAIDLALTDSESRRKYGAFCRTRAEQSFSIDSVGRQLDRLYHQIAR